VAARGLRGALPEGAPLMLCGFSNGGALAAEYAADAVEDPELPEVDRLALFSPMIGITSLARTTLLYPWVGRISGLEEVAWSRVDAPIDPFKYSSWPMNASVQAWRMTQRVERRLRELDEAGLMDRFPPVIAFQSVVDATVRVPLLIERLFDRLDPPDDAAAPSLLVLYDVNRYAGVAELLSTRFEVSILPLLERDAPGYTLSVVTNASAGERGVVERRYVAGEPRERALDLIWPEHVFSLSHGAIPVPFDDPILGQAEAGEGRRLPLGDLSLRGETGVLQISEALMVRLRANPFYDHLEATMLSWLEPGTPGDAP
jgi:hypothetical protein